MQRAKVQSKLWICIDPQAEPINTRALIGHLVDGLYKMAERLKANNPIPPKTETDSMSFEEFDLTTAQAAVRLHRTQSNIYQLMREGKIQGRKIAGRWRVRSQDVEALLTDAVPSTQPQPAA